MIFSFICKHFMSINNIHILLSRDASFLHTTILTMCTAKKVNLNLEARAPLRCRLS
jgi:hypothetical protein